MTPSELKVSMGLVTSNDEKTIGDLLNSLIKLYHSKEPSYEILELIIVSSGCYDMTEKIIYDYQTRFPDFIQIIIEKKRTGKANAINFILHEYKGDALVLLPSDVYTTKKSILALIKRFLSNSCFGVVTGHPIIVKKNSKSILLYKMVTTLWNLHNLTFLTLSSKNKNTHATGELMMMRRCVVSNVPSKIINDDAYIALIASEKHWKVGYEPSAFVSINIPIYLSDYISQRKRVILGHKQLQRIKKQQTTTYKYVFKKHFSESLSIISNLRSIKSLFYLAVLSFLELYIEFSITFSISQERDIHIWKRISTDILP